MEHGDTEAQRHGGNAGISWYSYFPLCLCTSVFPCSKPAVFVSNSRFVVILPITRYDSRPASPA